ncbi:hypothetical protein [Spirillospora sp. NBC_01491]|uniref:hypothetical protein n=1 Tax=Spirillospora sp. NBC_01491 TaxID=2976007 RepID=UPI002E310A57|nr:hypothetical protein [Spirillospora sp. NBC_01491]
MSDDFVPVERAEPAKALPSQTAEDRVKEVMTSLATYWGRACVNAVRTVFPRKDQSS